MSITIPKMSRSSFTAVMATAQQRRSELSPELRREDFIAEQRGKLALMKKPCHSSCEMNEYARITPHQLAALSLCRAADTLEQAASNPASWFFVFVDLHRALYCALVAATSGPAGIGAYDDKLQAEFIRAWDESRGEPYPREPAPKRRGKKFDDEHHVLPFIELLQRAKLQLSPEQHEDIVRLNAFRDKLEHVKPETWSVPVAGLDRMCASASTAFANLLESFSRCLQAEELTQVEAALSKFAAHKS
jgi:hypothetical protein